MADELKAALEEWRRARQDIFDNVSKFSTENAARWKRLADAETALMKIAKEMAK